jgi:hypothetical protein
VRAVRRFPEQHNARIPNTFNQGVVLCRIPSQRERAITHHREHLRLSHLSPIRALGLFSEREPLTSLTCTGHCNYDACCPKLAQRNDGGLHRRARRKPVVDENYGAIANVDWTPATTIEPVATV